jgi:glycosyltransferase involved in cell wall biosynthesis
MTEVKQISIIIPSFNDARIARAIRSVRSFDDIATVRIIVVDGGSNPELQRMISSLLTAEDTFICEPDNGIFDALNKGLGCSATEFIGWLGSDDFYSGRVRASFVIASLQTHDLLVANNAIFRGNRITRLTHSLPSRARLAKFGLHNPHFATFGRRSLLGNQKFALRMRSADIEYFLRVFETAPRVATVPEVAVISEEGGFSTASRRMILASNAELIDVYARYSGRVLAPLCVGVKLAYKLWSIGYYRIFRRYVSTMCVEGVWP